MATKTTDTTNDAGSSPCTPEAHQRADLKTMMKEEDVIRKTARAGVLLRLYRMETPGGLYVVQQIINAGKNDRRKKAASRERRTILIKTAGRAEAVAVFNEKMDEIEREEKAGS